MRLYLLRHAEASYDAPTDDERELTPKGEDSIVKLCGRLKAKEFEGLSTICHSTLTRAKQTAELFRDGLGLDAGLKEIGGLAPMNDPTALTDQLVSSREDMMLVGHNPHLTILAGWLLAGDCGATMIDFKKSGLLCLERGATPTPDRPAGEWILSWFLIKRPVLN